MNGYQVLEILKRDTTWRDIPVLMISALDEMDSVLHCIENHALRFPAAPVLQKLVNSLYSHHYCLMTGHTGTEIEMLSKILDLKIEEM